MIDYFGHPFFLKILLFLQLDNFVSRHSVNQ